MNRRQFLKTTASGILIAAAPAIVQAENIMRVRPIATPTTGKPILLFGIDGNHMSEPFAAIRNCHKLMDEANVPQVGRTVVINGWHWAVVGESA